VIIGFEGVLELRSMERTKVEELNWRFVDERLELSVRIDPPVIMRFVWM